MCQTAVSTIVPSVMVLSVAHAGLGTVSRLTKTAASVSGEAHRILGTADSDMSSVVNMKIWL